MTFMQGLKLVLALMLLACAVVVFGLVSYETLKDRSTWDEAVRYNKVKVTYSKDMT